MTTSVQTFIVFYFVWKQQTNNILNYIYITENKY